MRTVAAKRRTSRLRIFRTWLWRLSLLDLFLLVVLYLLEATVAERVWVTLLLTYVSQHPLLVPAGVLLLLSLLLRHGRAMLVNLLALLFVLFGFMGLAIPHWYGTAPPGQRVRVMTLNVAYFKELTPATLADLVAKQHLDVVCLQEASPLRYGTLVTDYRHALPPGWSIVVEGELSVLTRLPVRTWRVHPYAEKNRAALAVELTAGDTPFTVINTHFTTAYPPESYKFQWRELARYLYERAAMRQRQAEELLTFLQEQPGAVLLAGDFNTPPRGLIYRHLAGRMRDAFVTAGTGLGYSFHSHRPRYRIDFLFAGEEVEPQSCRTLYLHVSDHCPVVGEFVLKGT